MRSGRGVALLGGLALAVAAAATPAGSSATGGFRVGADVETINPAYPVYLGGYGAGRPGGTIDRATDPLTGRAEDLTVRAVAFGAAGRVVEFAAIDTQGDMAGYQEGPYGISDSRNAAARFLAEHGVKGAGPQDIIVSSLHEHAVPTLFGVWGPPAHAVPYMAQVSAAVTNALERAFLAMRGATLSWGTVEAPWLGGGDLAEGNEFEGWPRDGQLIAMWARDVSTGATIATLVDDPAYPNIVHGPTDVIQKDATPTSVIAHDFPGYVEELLQVRLGGVAVVVDGSLANQASPMQADDAPSPNLAPRGGLAYTRGFDDALQMASVVTNLALQALGQMRPVGHTLVDGTEREVTTPVDNPALVVLGLLTADQDAAAPIGKTTTIYPVDRAFTPPYGDVATINTWVTGLRIGDVVFLSEPGEFFPSIHEAWSKGIPDAAAVAVVGAAQDFLGYDYPVSTLPFTALGGDEHIFGPSALLGDQVVAAGLQDAASLGFRADLTSQAETTALENDDTAVTRPGVLITPSAVAVDINPRTHEARVRFLASSDPARIDMGCANPALLFEPPGCPLPEAGMGPFQWTFGDGTSQTTPIQAHVRAYFSPFVVHAYTKPGSYVVTVQASDANGNVATMSIPITVYPALAVRVVRSHGVARAVVQGGDGRPLLVVWRFRGGRTAVASAVAAPPRQAVEAIVLDSTGAIAFAIG